MTEESTQLNPLNVETFITESNSWQEGTIIDITHMDHLSNSQN